MSTKKNYSQSVRFSFQYCTAPASMPASFRARSFRAPEWPETILCTGLEMILAVLGRERLTEGAQKRGKLYNKIILDVHQPQAAPTMSHRPY